ncbi:hypothetical protein GPECTOR_33g568 [Gonium pectorale]|uniref:Uncharacterized protein n=1 Tax=Gonium pectorale TaxID=33097 RepID=A0A150GCW8_GONPE|nr:hypothetical protein GPECTOR_33g568 [Gonium pectorale]|eukprot:KXZ47686.1 hypothetical protein GPECTOR_33g568 [Gonium pectorale]
MGQSACPFTFAQLTARGYGFDNCQPTQCSVSTACLLSCKCMRGDGVIVTVTKDLTQCAGYPDPTEITLLFDLDGDNTLKCLLDRPCTADGSSLYNVVDYGAYYSAPAVFRASGGVQSWNGDSGAHWLWSDCNANTGAAAKTVVFTGCFNSTAFDDDISVKVGGMDGFFQYTTVSLNGIPARKGINNYDIKGTIKVAGCTTGVQVNFELSSLTVGGQLGSAYAGLLDASAAPHAIVSNAMSGGGMSTPSRSLHITSTSSNTSCLNFPTGFSDLSFYYNGNANGAVAVAAYTSASCAGPTIVTVQVPAGGTGSSGLVANPLQLTPFGALAMSVRVSQPSSSSISVYIVMWATSAFSSSDPSGSGSGSGSVVKLLGDPDNKPKVKRQLKCKPAPDVAWVPAQSNPRWVVAEFEQRPQASIVASVLVWILNVDPELDDPITDITMQVLPQGSTADRAARQVPIFRAAGQELSCPALNRYNLNATLISTALPLDTFRSARIMHVGVNISTAAAKRNQLPQIAAVGLQLA